MYEKELPTENPCEESMLESHRSRHPDVVRSELRLKLKDLRFLCESVKCELVYRVWGT